MLIESLLKTSILPGGLLLLACVLTQGLRQDYKARAQGLIAGCCFLLGTYFLKGEPSWPPEGGLEGLQWLSLFFLFYTFWQSKLVLGILSFVFLTWPLYQGSGLSLSWFQNACAFFLLMFCIWSFSERQIHRGIAIPTLVCAHVMITASAIFCLLKSSALMSQTFGILAALSGFLILYGLIFKPRFSPEMSASFFVAFPLTLLGGLHLYMDLNPYHTMAMALPFTVLLVRSYTPILTAHPWTEAVIMALLSAAPTAWFIKSTLT